MGSFLRSVSDAQRAEAAARRSDGALERAKDAAATAPPPRDFVRALAAPRMSLVAEVKRASPSAGPIAPGIDAVALARAYEAGGAAAVSVLTEPRYFHGSLDDLRAVRAAVSIPVLRKDFVCDPLHVWEARAAGADALLLIVAALSQTELVSLADLAQEIGMATLVEAHSAGEVARAVDSGARVIGINTRDLATLEVDSATVGRLRRMIPDGVIVVGESGVKERIDVESMERVGCDAVLVGEALVRARDPAAKIRELLGH